MAFARVLFQHFSNFTIEFIPSFQYFDISFTVDEFSHSAATLSKLYINNNQLSYTEYGVEFRV